MMTGIIIGKFNVIHKGHLYLVDKALEEIGNAKLFVFLCSCENDLISGENRVMEFRKIYPQIEFIHVKDEIEEASSAYTEAPKIWSKYVLKELEKFGSYKVDFVFGSENYTKILAEILKAKSFLVDIKRRLIPVSSSEILKDPIINWSFIPSFMKKYFLKIIFVDFEIGDSLLKYKDVNHCRINNYEDLEKELKKIDEDSKIVVVNLDSKTFAIDNMKKNYKFIHDKKLLLEELKIL